MQLVGINPKATFTAQQIQRGEAGGPIGVVAMDEFGNKHKLLLFNHGAGAVACEPGKVAYYYAPGGASAGAVNECTCDVSDSAAVGAGVAGAAIPNGHYGWFQVSGPATLHTALTAGADGNALTPVGAGDGTLDVSAAVTDSICATAIDASAKIVMCHFPH